VSGSDRSGDAGAPKPPPEPETDPDVQDYGPAAEGDDDPEPDAGTSGADEGISPWSPQAYDEDPEGPTTSTED
jgi:hypothetical protein